MKGMKTTALVATTFVVLSAAAKLNAMPVSQTARDSFSNKSLKENGLAISVPDSGKGAKGYPSLEIKKVDNGVFHVMNCTNARGETDLEGTLNASPEAICKITGKAIGDIKTGDILGTFNVNGIQVLVGVNGVSAAGDLSESVWESKSGAIKSATAAPYSGKGANAKISLTMEDGTVVELTLSIVRANVTLQKSG